MSQIFLIRHGQSFWNLENKFTGKADINLTEKGREEALQLVSKIPEINLAFVSDLIRAQETAMLALSAQKIACQRMKKYKKSHDTLPVVVDARLNERCYGNLQGLNKDEARKKFGAEQVHKWRRGFYDRPPAGESLADTVLRVQEFYSQQLSVLLESDLNIAIFAHGNSIRAMHKIFLNISEEEIMAFELKTGDILSYIYESNGFIRQNYE